MSDDVPSAEADEVTDVLDEGPFFHGTKADLKVGDLLTAGFRSRRRSVMASDWRPSRPGVRGSGSTPAP